MNRLSPLMTEINDLLSESCRLISHCECNNKVESINLVRSAQRNIQEYNNIVQDAVHYKDGSK